MRERLRGKRGYLLTVAMVTGIGAIGLVFLPSVIAGELTTPPVQGTELILLSKFAPWMIMIMVLGILTALMGSLFMIYWYIARVRTTEIHRQLLLDAVSDYQYRKLRGERGGRGTGTGYGIPLDETPEGRAAREKREKEEEDEREREDQGHRDTARREAAIIVPQTLSVAGMGITGNFFIELTAILTIIFGILILGLLGVLGTREIAPILAAIAGYVLGKTTSGQPPQAASPAPQVATSPASQVGGSQPLQPSTP